MTRDDIIRLVIEADGRITDYINYDFGEEVALFYIEELERFAALVAAAEREACAEICRAYAMPDGTSITAMVLEKAIRARGEL